MNLRRFDVLSLYALHRLVKAFAGEADVECTAFGGMANMEGILLRETRRGSRWTATAGKESKLQPNSAKQRLKIPATGKK